MSLLNQSKCIAALAALAAGLSVVDARAAGPKVPFDITFEIPVKLTRLSPHVSAIKVDCGVTDRSGWMYHVGGNTGVNATLLDNGKTSVPASTRSIDKTLRVKWRFDDSDVIAQRELVGYHCILLGETELGTSPFSTYADDMNLRVEPGAVIEYTGKF